MVSNKIINGVKLVAVSVLFLGVSTFAQYNDTQTGMQQDTTTTQGQYDGTTTDNTGSWSTDGQVSSTYDTTYSSYQVSSLQDLVLDLQTRLNLDDDQIEEIRETLEEYQQKVADVKSEYQTNVTQEDGVVTDDTELIGSDENIQTELRDLDKETNEEIEDALEEEQVSQYVSIKREWWSKVKDFVHSPNAANMQNNQDMNSDFDRGNESITPGSENDINTDTENDTYRDNTETDNDLNNNSDMNRDNEGNESSTDWNNSGSDDNSGSETNR